MASVETLNDTPSACSADQSTGSNAQDRNIYIRDMEYGMRQDLCNRLNRSECLEALCERMGYPRAELDVSVN